MDIIIENCCGLDVHKSSVSACFRRGGQSEVRTFSTTTGALLGLSDWLCAGGCTHVAMEATGVYWKPIYNILEGSFEVLLVNAQHIKTVPGRKTDVKDSEWIAKLLQHGLLKASFVPSAEFRELRDLTRSRTKIIQSRTSVANRISKVLEDANIKLGSVASNILGKSCRLMLEAIISGNTDAVALADMSKKKLRRKIPELIEALEGRITEHHRFMLERLLNQVDHLDNEIDIFSRRIDQKMTPFREQLKLMDTASGVDIRVAECVLAEIGPDMGQFPSDKHISSWASICPGNNKSGGKNKSGKIRKGNNWLRCALLQAAWAAVRKGGTYLSAMYHRLVRRRGKKRAIVAVAHEILVSIYHILRDKCEYRELGADHYDRINPDQVKRNIIRRLQSMGFAVTLQPIDPAA
ncbi:MAG: IS110 family RNA-guided transposase [Armatimonadota bacterium]